MLTPTEERACSITWLALHGSPAPRLKRSASAWNQRQARPVRILLQRSSNRWAAIVQNWPGTSTTWPARRSSARPAARAFVLRIEPRLRRVSPLRASIPLACAPGPPGAARSACPPAYRPARRPAGHLAAPARPGCAHHPPAGRYQPYSPTLRWAYAVKGLSRHMLTPFGRSAIPRSP